MTLDQRFDPSYRGFASDLIPPVSEMQFSGGYTDVTQCAEVSSDLLKAVQVEVAAVASETQSNYDAYHNGRWRLLALVNSTGDSFDTSFIDTAIGQPTEILKAMTATTRLLDTYFTLANVVTARIARFEPGGNLWEHADINPTIPAAYPPRRYHVPIFGDPEAVFVSSAHRVFMAPGYVWKMEDITTAHGITHGGNTDRVHIIVDYRGPLMNALSECRIDPQFVHALPRVDEQTIEAIVKRAKECVIAGEIEYMEDGMRSLFFRVDLGGVPTHALVRDVYCDLGEGWESKVEEWDHRLTLHMHGDRGG